MKKTKILALSALLLASCGNSAQAQGAVRDGTWRDDAETIYVYALNSRYDYNTIDKKGAPIAWLIRYMISGDSIHLELEDRIDEANRFYRSYYHCSWSIDYKK